MGWLVCTILFPADDANLKPLHSFPVAANQRSPAVHLWCKEDVRSRSNLTSLIAAESHRLMGKLNSIPGSWGFWVQRNFGLRILQLRPEVPAEQIQKVRGDQSQALAQCSVLSFSDSSTCSSGSRMIPESCHQETTSIKCILQPECPPLGCCSLNTKSTSSCLYDLCMLSLNTAWGSRETSTKSTQRNAALFSQFCTS